MPDRLTNSRVMGYMIALRQVGFEMVVPIGVGVFLDRWLGTVPWLMVGGVLLGLVGGFAHLIAILQRMDRTKTDQPPTTPP